ncbi:ABC transporter permease [Aeromicrobium sp. 9AM]|uniref:ABC transporter permease n=1 Tax=Aeromicrobium sp. 9AM TaxID=2653126 RepID=UPI0012F31A1D|nr:ABC transporter permease [Aeromicrobium sp. 9AM]VXB62470.1 Putrescine transport system permease protein [Aeromicrobium sp. 9AM]
MVDQVVLTGHRPATSVGRPGLRRPRVNGWALLVLPGLIFTLIAFGWPLAEVLVRSFGGEGAAHNYSVTFTTPAYRSALVSTLLTSAAVTVSCLVIGYPYAYLMAMSRRTELLLALILLPIWTSFLVRTYAWQIWLQDTGVINTTLQKLGIIDDPLELIRNRLGVTIGMTGILLPFAILPLYTVMRRIDRELVRAAENLGARPSVAFRRVFVPLSLPGVYSAALLVFVLALGFYIAPAILGGTSSPTLSTVIVDKVQRELDFHTASAIGITLLAVAIVVLTLGSRVVRIRDVFGGGAP